jgi:hypothetical protein
MLEWYSRSRSNAILYAPSGKVQDGQYIGRRVLCIRVQPDLQRLLAGWVWKDHDGAQGQVGLRQCAHRGRILCRDR